jgi:hypothetical protein
MSITEMRDKAHQLVDKASEGYLVEVLDLLELETLGSHAKYTEENIARFNKIAKDIENNPVLGITVEEAFAKIRDDYKNAI